MKVIKPQPITDANLFSSSVAETDAPVWDVGATYAVGAVVMRPAIHTLFESVVAGNVGNIPEDTTIEDLPSAPKWLDLGKTNRWKMFDSKVNTQTSAPDELTVVVLPQNTNSLGLFELEGKSVNVKVISPSSAIVYDKDIPLEASVVTDWYEYFFAPFDQVRQIVLTDLPAYFSGKLQVTIEGETAKCGHFATGFAYEIGQIEYGATAGITDYSRKDTDIFGNTEFIQRPYANRMNAKLWLDNSTLNGLQRTLAGLRATPCVWIGTEDPTYGPLVVYGWYKDFSIEVAYFSTSYCTLEVEGLT